MLPENHTKVKPIHSHQDQQSRAMYHKNNTFGLAKKLDSEASDDGTDESEEETYYDSSVRQQMAATKSTQ